MSEDDDNMEGSLPNEDQLNDNIEDDDENEIIDEENAEEKNSNKNDDEKNIRKPGEKQKRRSKNDCSGRDYRCGCGKTYLSYPALYTHIKTKHNGKTPEGTNANQIQNGKGRGRPRKNFLMNEDVLIRRKRENNRKYNENQNNELRDFLNHSNCSLEYIREGEGKFFAVYHFFGLLLEKEDKKYDNKYNYNSNSPEKNNIINNNINNSNNIQNNMTKNNDNEFSEMMNLNATNMMNNTSLNLNLNLNITNISNRKDSIAINNDEQINNTNLIENININWEEEKYNILDLFDDELIKENNGYKKLYECAKLLLNDGYIEVKKFNQKENITCDQAFVLYLIYISQIVKKTFCKINLIVIKYYRDLVNLLGWNLLSEFKSLLDEDTSKEFSSIKEPLKIPLIAEDFCNNYMKEVLKEFDNYFTIIIISHFNFWLYANDLTFIKLNLPNIEIEKNSKMKSKEDNKNSNINNNENNLNDNNSKKNIEE